MAFGSLLLSVAIRLLVVALVHGKTGILEHPAELDTEPNMVSIWKTHIIRTLLRFPRCRKLLVLQGYYGAKSKKPTNLLLVNGSVLLREINLSPNWSVDWQRREQQIEDRGA